MGRVSQPNAWPSHLGAFCILDRRLGARDTSSLESQDAQNEECVNHHVESHI